MSSTDAVRGQRIGLVRIAEGDVLVDVHRVPLPSAFSNHRFERTTSRSPSPSMSPDADARHGPTGRCRAAATAGAGLRRCDTSAGCSCPTWSARRAARRRPGRPAPRRGRRRGPCRRRSARTARCAACPCCGTTRRRRRSRPSRRRPRRATAPPTSDGDCSPSRCRTQRSGDSRRYQQDFAAAAAGDEVGPAVAVQVGHRRLSPRVAGQLAVDEVMAEPRLAAEGGQSVQQNQSTARKRAFRDHGNLLGPAEPREITVQVVARSQ